jgi:hypothetical protein
MRRCHRGAADTEVERKGAFSAISFSLFLCISVTLWQMRLSETGMAVDAFSLESEKIKK